MELVLTLLYIHLAFVLMVAAVCFLDQADMRDIRQMPVMIVCSLCVGLAWPYIVIEELREAAHKRRVRRVK